MVSLGVRDHRIEDTVKIDVFIVLFSPVGARGRTRKHMRFFVPAFLVFSQIGWYALAIAGVKLLAIKAFLVAKIALIVVAAMTFKKLLEPVA